MKQVNLLRRCKQIPRWALLLSIPILTSCGATLGTRLIGALTGPPVLECPNPPTPDMVELVPPTWTVIEAQEAQWIALTPKQYEQLSLNLSLVLQNLKQRNAVIDYLNSCIHNYNELHTGSPFTQVQPGALPSRLPGFSPTQIARNQFYQHQRRELEQRIQAWRTQYASVHGS